MFTFRRRITNAWRTNGWLGTQLLSHPLHFIAYPTDMKGSLGDGKADTFSAVTPFKELYSCVISRKRREHALIKKNKAQAGIIKAHNSHSHIPRNTKNKCGHKRIHLHTAYRSSFALTRRKRECKCVLSVLRVPIRKLNSQGKYMGAGARSEN